jgi:hypothetical protein
VEEDNGVLTALLGIALQHIAQALAIIAQIGVKVANRARRANRGTTASTLAQKGIDFDALRQALNRLGRTCINTLCADYPAINRMGADRSVIVEIPGLLEFTT